jgi:hypothetical protein
LRREYEGICLKSVILCFLEKLRKEKYINPYRKPTQVDEKRILRRLGKLQLRNSANWCRNFGIRHAFFGETVYRLS